MPCNLQDYCEKTLLMQHIRSTCDVRSMAQINGVLLDRIRGIVQLDLSLAASITS